MKKSHSHLLEKTEEKYEFIEDCCSLHSVERMCKVLKVSKSGFYDWYKRGINPREKENAMIIDTIIGIWTKEPKKQVYGSPRLTKELEEHGLSFRQNRIARVMQKANIRAKTKKKFKNTTDSTHNNPVAPNLLNQNFAVDAPDKAWVMDITYVWTEEGWLYLAIVLDLFSRMVVGWATDKRINKELVVTAFNKAVEVRTPQEGLIAHSDRGSQYTSYDFSKLLKLYQYKQSMSGTGNCYDNAVAESFFHTLKSEWIFFERYKTRAEARTSIFDYIETFYNRERRHSTIGYVSPQKFEQDFLSAA
ncbi:IS3 family transposase [Candidatus Margulisiibacteriota bacterium]